MTAATTLREVLDALGTIEKLPKTPTAKKLRENAKPLASLEGCTIYDNGYCTYENDWGRTVMWLPDCTHFTYHFVPLRDSEKIEGLNEVEEVPDGLLESEPWIIAVTLIGNQRVESNSMNRTGNRRGTVDYDTNDHGDKDGDREEANRETFAFFDDPYGENPESAYIRKETRERALDSLTEKQREAFVLYYRDGYTQQEIADMMGISQVGVIHHLEGALKKVKRFFR